MAMHLVVLLWSSVVSNGCPVAAGQAQRPERNPHVSKLTPEFAPAVADNPVVALLSIVAPANNGDHVIHTLIVVLRFQIHSSAELQQQCRMKLVHGCRSPSAWHP